MDMSFNSETGSAAGQKGSAGKTRWKGKDPSTNRTEQIRIKVTVEELKIMDIKSRKHGLSRTELIVQAVNSYLG